jgi:CTP:molybdopterin cytidylyltransferase MocA
MSGGVAGLLLAAGAGRRMGAPKALLQDTHGVPFLDRAIGVLFAGGCASVTVVLGAEAVRAELLLADAGWSGDDRVDVVVAPDWEQGMGASLRAGLSILEDGTADGALVSLVDLPDVGEDVVRRVLSAGSGPRALVRATYAGRPGHPVLIGREHWSGAAESADGDSGARAYLDSHDLTLCACDDLATGRDVDRPEDLSG